MTRKDSNRCGGALYPEIARQVDCVVYGIARVVEFSDTLETQKIMSKTWGWMYNLGFV